MAAFAAHHENQSKMFNRADAELQEPNRESDGAVKNDFFPSC